MGHGQVIDSMIHDGLWCPFENWHMGNAGEIVAEHYKVTRDEQDRVRRRESSEGGGRAGRRARSRTRFSRCRFRRRRATRSSFDRDESIRADTTAEALRALKPAFKKDGIGDGRQRASRERRRGGAGRDERGSRARRWASRRWRASSAQATSGLAPKMLLMTPVEAMRKVLKKAGWSIERRRPVRAQRSLRGAGGRGDARAGRRSGARQRQRRRGGARSPDWRVAARAS